MLSPPEISGPPFCCLFMLCLASFPSVPVYFVLFCRFTRFHRFLSSLVRRGARSCHGIMDVIYIRNPVLTVLIALICIIFLGTRASDLRSLSFGFGRIMQLAILSAALRASRGDQNLSSRMQRAGPRRGPPPLVPGPHAVTPPHRISPPPHAPSHPGEPFFMQALQLSRDENGRPEAVRRH